MRLKIGRCLNPILNWNDRYNRRLHVVINTTQSIFGILALTKNTSDSQQRVRVSELVPNSGNLKTQPEISKFSIYQFQFTW